MVSFFINIHISVRRKGLFVIHQVTGLRLKKLEQFGTT
jgi:hypothetical protein